MESAPSSARPTPVRSAKEAINARAQAQAQTGAQLAKSAKEVFNNSARETARQTSKSASRLHHTSLTKNVESVRTSASALLRVAKSPEPTQPDDTTKSADPLAKTPTLAKKTKKPEETTSVSVVRTSLKLGAQARPVQPPVVLPPHARMAQSARPVQYSQASELDVVQAFEESLSLPARNNNALEAAIRSARGLGSGNHTEKQSLSAALVASHHGLDDHQSAPLTSTRVRSRTTPTDHSVAVKTGTPATAPKSEPSAIPIQRIKRPTPRRAVNSAQTASTAAAATTAKVTTAPRPRPKGIRDPQMLSGAPRPLQRAAKNLKSSSTADIISVQLGQPATKRFRPAPKDYATAQPKSIDIYGMLETEEPKTPPARPAPRRKLPEDQLGVVEDYHPPEYPVKNVKDVPKTQAVPVGVGPDDPTPVPPTRYESTGAPNQQSLAEPVATPPATAPDNNRYALGERSPFFLKSVNVEKRPLSEGPVRTARPTIDRLGIQPNFADEPELTDRKKRKNTYSKRQKKVAKSKAASKPTVIIPNSRRSKAPLVFLIILTIILGAAVGAAAYLCFFQ